MDFIDRSVFRLTFCASRTWFLWKAVVPQRQEAEGRGTAAEYRQGVIGYQEQQQHSGKKFYIDNLILLPNRQIFLCLCQIVSSLPSCGQLCAHGSQIVFPPVLGPHFFRPLYRRLAPNRHRLSPALSTTQKPSSPELLAHLTLQRLPAGGRSAQPENQPEGKRYWLMQNYVSGYSKSSFLCEQAKQKQIDVKQFFF